MESKKQIKAQLTNEIAKRYKDRIKELEDSRNALRTKIAIERKQFSDLQYKYIELIEEIQKLKDWNNRLMEFMEMTPEDKQKYVENLEVQKQHAEAAKRMESFINMYRNLFF